MGDAIRHELENELVESIDKLGKYGETVDEIINKKNEQIYAVQNISPIKKFFLKIKGLFAPEKPVNLSLTEEERKKLDESLQEYKDIDTKIWNYNLEDNLLHSLVKEIIEPYKLGKFKFPHRYKAENVPRLLEESVIPDLKKLGLEHLIPELQESLIEEYKKDIPDSRLCQIKDEDMYLYVPDFSKKPEKQHEITTEELKKAQEIVKSILENGGETANNNNNNKTMNYDDERD